MDLLNHLITERPFLFLRYVIYAIIFIGSLIGFLVAKYKNRKK